MQHFSPIKIVAGIAAVVLSITGLFFASNVRQAVSDILSIKREKPRATAAQQPPVEVSAKASGVRVIPFGVADKPASANAGK
ncbi:hypothetical protein [Mitsuaria sp. GD03876]|uniref:hypothetical protein n=1 Tax=Mitsuaria sp. GD03876 TaxID=2975399 RepID=UPI0024475FDE|nr:hypothetical protein [Mitsuaria sp. GD03876]MDH0865157.1 hypothetical protein [Mitsuaria sp. GD03876]